MVFSAAAKQGYRLVLDLVFPPRCGCCGERVEMHGNLCVECWNAVHFLSEPLCHVCGIPFAYDMGRHASCAECLEYPPPFRHARAAFRYEGQEARQLIHGFKFHDHTQMLPVFSMWLERVASPLVHEVDVIIPVPLHWRRLMQRGYNQSAMLARLIGRRSNKPVLVQGLKRLRYTVPQASLDRAERMGNVEDVFAVNSKYAASIAGKRVLLVDDVMTTGSTVKACAQTLLGAGAASVNVLTLARTCKLD